MAVSRPSLSRLSKLLMASTRISLRSLRANLTLRAGLVSRKLPRANPNANPAGGPRRALLAIVPTALKTARPLHLPTTPPIMGQTPTRACVSESRRRNRDRLNGQCLAARLEGDHTSNRRAKYPSPSPSRHMGTWPARPLRLRPRPHPHPPRTRTPVQTLARTTQRSSRAMRGDNNLEMQSTSRRSRTCRLKSTCSHRH